MGIDHPHSKSGKSGTKSEIIYGKSGEKIGFSTNNSTNSRKCGGLKGLNQRHHVDLVDL